MSLHAELLKQARFLARKEPQKPSQASLRRSVSASYYALFHLLVDEATKLMLTSEVRGPLRDSLARAFHHSDMKQIAVLLSKRQMPKKLAAGLNGQELQQPLINVAKTFVDLQEARQEADYNRARRYTRREVLDLADLTSQAFADWRKVRRSLPADVFLTGLLTHKYMRG